MAWTVLIEHADELNERPWLIPFVEEADVELADVEERWRSWMAAARVELRRRGIDLRRCQITETGLDTTSLAWPVGECYETRSTAIMQTATSPRVQVENDASKVLRGIAVPFGERTLVLGADDNPVAEEFSRDSFDRLPAAPVPLLVGHRRDAPPAGRVNSFGYLPQGLGFEAELVGSDNEMEGWRRRLAAGISDNVSIGFTQAKRRARWSKPERRGAAPVVSPRGVEVVELSLVNFPAYDNAKIFSLSQRTARGDVEHAESERAILDWQAWRAKQDRLSGRRAG